MLCALPHLQQVLRNYRPRGQLPMPCDHQATPSSSFSRCPRRGKPREIISRAQSLILTGSQRAGHHCTRPTGEGPNAQRGDLPVQMVRDAPTLEPGTLSPEPTSSCCWAPLRTLLGTSSAQVSCVPRAPRPTRGPAVAPHWSLSTPRGLGDQLRDQLLLQGVGALGQEARFGCRGQNEAGAELQHTCVTRSTLWAPRRSHPATVDGCARPTGGS